MELSTSNIYLSLLGSTWICSLVHAKYSAPTRVHAEEILDQIQKRTEPYGSALVCTGPKYCETREQVLHPSGTDANILLLKTVNS